MSANRACVIWMYAPDVPQWNAPGESLAAIRSAFGPGWDVHEILEPLDATGDGDDAVPKSLQAAIPEAEVFFGFGIQPRVFEAARALRWVHSGAAGVGGSLFPAMRESDVILTNSAGMHAETMAEHGLAGLFHFSRALDVATRAQARAAWSQDRLIAADSPLHGPLGELAGAVLGIVGYGGIGRALGRRAHAIGMRIHALRRTRGALPPEVEWMGGTEDLATLLGASDAVALTLPETSATRQLIGSAELALMRRHAVLINLARGAIVDEAALTEALMERRLRGAALDAFEQEPLPPDHPFWTLDNVLITPHVGGTSRRYWERETELITRNIARYLAGEELLNRVDKERGY